MRAHLVVVVVVINAVAGGCPGRPQPPRPPVPDAGPQLPGACADDTNKPVTPAPGSIYFGTRAPTLVPLDAAQQNAVVGVTDTSSTGAFCSGSLITDTVVLTALHCTVGVPPAQLVVLFGPDDLNPILSLSPVEKRETDDNTDLAILRLDHAPANDIDVRPIPITLDAPATGDIGTLVENAGFGETEGTNHGRFFVTERFDGFDAQFIQVNGEGSRGVCFGDSGGPIMHVGPEGDVRVLGALSFGDAACMHVDNYSRVDTVRATFIEPLTGPTPVGLPQACGADVTVTGSCNVEQALATYCDAGNVVRDACGIGEICGANASGQFRCIAVADNPCGAVATYGACDGDTLSWCDNGVVKTRDCLACDERCILAAPEQGFACVASDCGALDHLGQCDGNTSRWCDNFGQAAQEDCAAEGTTCEFLGQQLGNYCLDQQTCQGHNYQGDCAGTVLTWCEDNELNTVDCAAQGLQCVFIDAATGNDCQ